MFPVWIAFQTGGQRKTTPKQRQSRTPSRYGIARAAAVRSTITTTPATSNGTARNGIEISAPSGG